MIEFFRAGGFNMFILAAVGGVLVATAIKFARNANAQRLSLIRALTVAMVFVTLTGFASGLAATAKWVVKHEPPDPLVALLQGFAESTANLLLGGFLLGITWILVAVGIRRMPEDPS
jgi:hypothetical protein